MNLWFNIRSDWAFIAYHLKLAKAIKVDLTNQRVTILWRWQ